MDKILYIFLDWNWGGINTMKDILNYLTGVRAVFRVLDNWILNE